MAPFFRTQRLLPTCLAGLVLAWGNLGCTPHTRTSGAAASLPATGNLPSGWPALAITYVPGDAAGSVTQDLGLPETLPGGVDVHWSSSAPALIATTGQVTRPAAGTMEVTLTAVLSRGPSTQTEAFVLLMAAPLETITTPNLTQTSGGSTVTTAAGTASLLVLGEPVAASTSQNATGTLTIEHGFWPPTF